ncbi:MAG: hypothetical protein QXL67_00825 [Candidatus Bathyarchaeia archaeon]
MPQKVICSKCGQVLFYGEELKTTDEIIDMNGGKCPNCGKELSFLPIKIEIKLAEARGEL